MDADATRDNAHREDFRPADVSSSTIRAVALRPCLLSYVFGTGILATTINLVLGAITT